MGQIGISNKLKFFTINSKRVIAIAALLTFLLGNSYSGWHKKEGIINNDVKIYYGYLTAAFMYGDMSFDFAYEMPKEADSQSQIWVNQTPEGKRAIKMTMGTAVMMSPFYLMAAGINKMTGQGSYGYSNLFQFFIMLGSIVYLILGLILLRKILLRYFKDGVVAWTIALVTLGTNLIYYSGVEPGMSHSYSFFLFAALIYATLKWHDKPSMKWGVLLGLSAGLIILVRPTNGLIILVPILYQVNSLSSARQKLQLILRKWSHLIVAGLTCFAIVFLQLAFWKNLSGDWVQYGYGDEGFFWSDPKIFEVVFSFRKGFVLYAPILILAIGGLFIRNKSINKWKFGAVIYLVLNLYVVSSWWCWWYGGSYGMRALVETLVILSIFMAVAIEKILKMKVQIKGIFVGFALLCLALNYTQIRQYKKGILHYDGMTAKAYQKIFLKMKHPDNYSDYIRSPIYEEAKKGINR